MAVSSVTALEAIALTEGGTWLLDVREQDEWNRGHAPAARLVPLSELGARIAELPMDQRVLAPCGRQRRWRARVSMRWMSPGECGPGRRPTVHWSPTERKLLASSEATVAAVIASVLSERAKSTTVAVIVLHQEER